MQTTPRVRCSLLRILVLGGAPGFKSRHPHQSTLGTVLWGVGPWLMPSSRSRGRAGHGPGIRELRRRCDRAVTGWHPGCLSAATGMGTAPGDATRLYFMAYDAYCQEIRALNSRILLSSLYCIPYRHNRTLTPDFAKIYITCSRRVYAREIAYCPSRGSSFSRGNRGRPRLRRLSP